MESPHNSQKQIGCVCSIKYVCFCTSNAYLDTFSFVDTFIFILKPVNACWYYSEGSFMTEWHDSTSELYYFSN